MLNVRLFVLRFHTYFSYTQHGVSWRWLLTIWGVGGQQYDRPPLSLTIQTDHKFKCYNIVGDKHTDLVDDRNVLHRNGRIIQNIVRLDFKFFLLLCMTNVNWWGWFLGRFSKHHNFGIRHIRQIGSKLGSIMVRSEGGGRRIYEVKKFPQESVEEPINLKSGQILSHNKAKKIEGQKYQKLLQRSVTIANACWCSMAWHWHWHWCVLKYFILY